MDVDNRRGFSFLNLNLKCSLRLLNRTPLPRPPLAVTQTILVLEEAHIDSRFTDTRQGRRHGVTRRSRRTPRRRHVIVNNATRMSGVVSQDGGMMLGAGKQMDDNNHTT